MTDIRSLLLDADETRLQEAVEAVLRVTDKVKDVPQRNRFVHADKILEALETALDITKG